MGRWIDQTTFYDKANPKSGNCTRAAVASILGLPLRDVFAFEQAGDDAYIFWTTFEDFLAQKGFWTMRKDTDRYVPEGYYLAGGPSVRGCDHMVVMKNGELAHDPHPSREGLVKVEHIWILIPFDPAQNPISRSTWPE